MKTYHRFLKPELIIFVLALAARLLFVREWDASPFGLAPFLDAAAYDSWAREIAAGHWLRGKVFYQSPLYPYVLALVYVRFGASTGLVSVLQAILGALTCVVLTRTLKRSFDAGVAIAAGALAAFYRPLIYFTAPIAKETLMIFLLVLFVRALLNYAEWGRARDAAFAGAWLGLTALTRGNVLALWLLLPIAPYVFRRGWDARGALVAALMTGACVLPATVHNFVSGQDWVLINSCGGFNAYVGNWSGATGANAYPPAISTEPAIEEQDTRRLAEAAVGRALKPSAVSAYWFGEALAAISDNPARALELGLKKFALFWNHQEIADNYDVNFIADQRGSVLHLPLVGFGFLSVLAVFGLVALWTSAAARLLALGAGMYMATCLPFYVTDRYRLPVVVFLLPLAGVGVLQLWRHLRARMWLRLVAPSVAAIPALALALMPLPVGTTDNLAFNYGLQASLLSDANKDRAALDAFAKAVTADEARISTQTYVKMSTVYERQGDLVQARNLLEAAVQAHPEDGYAEFNLGRYYLEHGNDDLAHTHFTRALEKMPYLHQPYIGLAALMRKQNRRTEAALAVRLGLERAPENAQLLELRRQLEGP